MATRRSVVRWSANHDLERLRRVAREAAMQSRQPFLPELCQPITFDEALALDGACLADASGGVPSLAHPVVLIGPEGGWDDGERAASIPAVRLGSTVLRAETAAVAAAVLLTALRSELVR
jgi:16S rRNA (uracil1498-N3)-methyltransferase